MESHWMIPIVSFATVLVVVPVVAVVVQLVSGLFDD